MAKKSIFSLQKDQKPVQVQKKYFLDDFDFVWAEGQGIDHILYSHSCKYFTYPLESRGFNLRQLERKKVVARV